VSLNYMSTKPGQVQDDTRCIVTLSPSTALRTGFVEGRQCAWHHYASCEPKRLAILRQAQDDTGSSG
jgi:hypothetical protein